MLQILFCLAVFCVFVFIRKKYSYWIERGITQDLAYPLFGINWKVLTHQASNTEIFQFLYNKHSDSRYIGVYDFLTPLLIIRDPDLLQQILIKNFEHFVDHRPSIPPNIDPLWNKNVANLKGNKWKEMRSSLSPAFTGNKMRYMFVLMQQCAHNFVDYFLSKEGDLIETEVRETFSRYINDVIASTCFGYSCDSLKDMNNEFYVRGMEASYSMGWWRHIKTALVRAYPWMSKVLKVTKFGESVTGFFKGVIRENVKFREKNNVKRPDMITLLMNARNETDRNDSSETNGDSDFLLNEFHTGSPGRKTDLSVDDITANALLFFFAGFSTTSFALCFIAYELAVNPDVQEKLLREIDSFRECRKEINYEDLSNFTYMHMVIAESLRKYPPFCRNDRQCTKHFTIQPEGDSEKPLTLEPGSNVWIPIYALHHDSKYWPDPDKFQPERFSPENKKNIKAGTYIPFGMGPRGCMAYRFVLQTMKLLLYELLSNFEIVPVDKTVIPCRLSENTSHIAPGSGFYFGFKRRKSSL